MHPNAAFRGDPGALLDRLLEGSAFATLFAHSPDGPRAAHVPILRSETGRLLFHLARPNALTRHLDGAQAMLVLQGPDAYVSARWYDAADQVPTWNYVALECDGAVSRRLGAVVQAGRDATRVPIGAAELPIGEYGDER